MITRDPQAEVEINKDLVYRLIKEQFPELSELKLEFLDSGWDNEIFRLGEDYVVRIPRRELALKLIQNEIKWLQFLKGKLPIAIPSPERVGEATDYYPWPWTIIPWFNGKSSNLALPDSSEAIRLMEFLKALHSIKAKDAPENKSRGVALESKAEAIKARMERLKTSTSFITEQIEAFWQLALNEPFVDSDYLIHGDLHSRNIIVNEGKFEAIVDWGDITSGDPATDLGILWMLFKDKEVRQNALNAYGADASLRIRARGWAVFFGLTLLDTGLNSNPQHAEMGKLILTNLANE